MASGSRGFGMTGSLIIFIVMIAILAVGGFSLLLNPYALLLLAFAWLVLR